MPTHPASPIAPSSGRTHRHSHMWLVGVVGLAAGLALMIYVPTLQAISTSMILFAAFHLIGGVVVLASVYATVGKRMPLSREPAGLDFGWTPAWTLGPLLAALVFMATAVVIELAAPRAWPLALAASLLAANAFAGYLLTRAAARAEHASLPWVDLRLPPDGNVLDGGCGAGRTSVELAHALPLARIVALDRFDADYIEQGGRALLERNLAHAGVADRVQIQPGDLTALPFANESFDAAASAHAMDHLGPFKEQGLREMWRVLKPGGRFLLVVWVPSWAMFAVANVLSFSLTRQASWRAMADGVGFVRVQEGSLNGHWYMLLGKPAGTGPSESRLR